MAGSCIGVVFLVVALEALRRGSREYDAFIVRSAMTKRRGAYTATKGGSEASSTNKDPATQTTTEVVERRKVVPTVLQQLVRAVLHMVQFAVAYFVGSLPCLGPWRCSR